MVLVALASIWCMHGWAHCRPAANKHTHGELSLRSAGLPRSPRRRSLRGRAMLSTVTQSVRTHLGFYLPHLSGETVLPRLATTARTAVQNGWWLSKPPRAHFPVLRADTEHRGACRNIRPGSPGIARRCRPPQPIRASDSRRPTRATRPAAVLSPLASPEARVTETPVHQRSYRSGGRLGHGPPLPGPVPGVATTRRPGCSVLSADDKQRSRVARSDRTRAAIRLPGALGRRGAE